TLGEFSAERQADLWSGIGLAAVYAGIAGEEVLENLREAAGERRAELAQGAAFAAKARQRAGNLTPYTDLAAKALCDLPALEAARLCDRTLEYLPVNAIQPAYEIWRQRIQGYFQTCRPMPNTPVRQASATSQTSRMAEPLLIP